uniref:Ca2+-binding protein, RTX toxin-related n=1 Tax=Alloyangia mangrovi TaxID=1779329 RepID=A0A2A3JXS3_9RHOB
MDETDGVSYMEVLVNGRVVTAFDWDKPEGTAIVTAATRAEHLVAGIVLARGDVIEVRGAQDGGEPLRTDYLDIAASASPAQGESFVIEAEALEILSGFSVVGNGAASADQVLQHTEGLEARAVYEVQQRGRFDLTLGYFDETDGVSFLQVLLNGEQIAAFDWDTDQGAAIASTASRTERLLAGLDLEVGDRLEFVGHGDRGEPLRLDTLTFTRALETVDYDPFLSELPNVEMVVRRGDHVALLTPLEDESRYDDEVLYRIVDATDRGWEFYALLTAQEPGLHPIYSIDGLGTFAVVERTIGAGGGYLGQTGIEMWADPYFDVYMHDRLRDTGLYDHVPFYELGRNFWFYGAGLGAIPVDVATSYAVTMQYYAMDFAGVEGAPFGTLTWPEIRAEILDDLSQYYLQDPTLDWGNTIEINAAPDWPEAYADWKGSDLLASLFARMMEDFGIEAYARMWQLIGQASYTFNADVAAENFFSAAMEATGIDYHFLRKQGGEDFVIGNDGQNALQGPEAPSAPLVMHGFAGDDHLESRTAWNSPGALLFGGGGNDSLVAGLAGDTLVGGMGNDVLEGLDRRAFLYGGDGDDWLSSAGHLYGGAGADTFALDGLVNGVASSNTYIHDYQPWLDVVDLGGHPIEYATETEGGVLLRIDLDALDGDNVYVMGVDDLEEIAFANLSGGPIPLRYETEDMEIVSGFEVVRNSVASGEYYLEHRSLGEAHARLQVAQNGAFDITVGYFDESDGLSSLAILLNGEEIAAFDWDDDTGSTLASRASKTEFTLEGLVLSGDDVFELVGHGDGDEPLRVDYLELTPTSLPGATDIWFEEVSPDGVGNRVMIGRNDGTGAFTEIDPGVRSDGRSVLAADVDGDGDDDFVELGGPQSLDGIVEIPPRDVDAVPVELDFSFTIHENIGGGQFVISESYDLRIELPLQRFILENGFLTLPEELLDIQDAADADGDGDIDLLATSYISESLLIFENDGAGHFQVMARSDATPLGADGNEALFIEFTGDEALDAIVATDGNDSPGLWLWINDGSGHLVYGGVFGGAEDSAGDPQVVDLDSDGDLDAIFIGGGEGHGINTMLNDSPLSSPSIVMGDFASVGSARAADFDGDGKAEMVAAGLSQGDEIPPGLRLFEVVISEDSVDFVEASYDPRSSGDVKAPADYDLDGDIDLLLTRGGPDGFLVTLLLNDGSGHFEDGGEIVAPFSPAEYSWGPQIHQGHFESQDSLL